MAAAYAASTRSTAAQSTVPLTTTILTGTPAAVVVVPQDVPADPAETLGEAHPATAASPARPSSQPSKPTAAASRLTIRPP